MYHSLIYDWSASYLVVINKQQYSIYTFIKEVEISVYIII